MIVDSKLFADLCALRACDSNGSRSLKNLCAGEYSFTVFVPAERPELFDEYRRIKYSVFVCELGWSSVPHCVNLGLAHEDPFDHQGLFVVAHGADGSAVGVARGLRIRGEFPHQSVFVKHLKAPELVSTVDYLATINSVAVVREHRGKRLSFGNGIGHATIGAALVAALIGQLARQRARVVFLSSAPCVGAKFFCRLGFYVIDKPFQCNWSPTSLINMALVTSDTERFSQVNVPPILADLSGCEADRVAAEVVRYFRALHEKCREGQLEGRCP